MQQQQQQQQPTGRKKTKRPYYVFSIIRADLAPFPLRIRCSQSCFVSRKNKNVYQLYNHFVYLFYTLIMITGFIVFIHLQNKWQV